jgi:hypothetical protein
VLVQSVSSFLNAQNTAQSKMEERLRGVELTCAGFPDFHRLEDRLEAMQKTLTECSTKIGEIRGGNKWIDYLVQIGISGLVSGTMVFVVFAGKH